MHAGSTLYVVWGVNIAIEFIVVKQVVVYQDILIGFFVLLLEM